MRASAARCSRSSFRISQLSCVRFPSPDAPFFLFSSLSSRCSHSHLRLHFPFEFRLPAFVVLPCVSTLSRADRERVEPTGLTEQPRQERTPHSHRHDLWLQGSNTFLSLPLYLPTFRPPPNHIPTFPPTSGTTFIKAVFLPPSLTG